MKKRIISTVVAMVILMTCMAVYTSAAKVAGTVYNGLKTGVYGGGESAAQISTDASGNLSLDLGSADMSLFTAWFTDKNNTELNVADFEWEFDYTTTNSWSNMRIFFRASNGSGTGDYCIWINGSDNYFGCAGNKEGYTDCRIALTENDKSGGDAVACVPFTVSPNTAYHVKLQVIGKEVKFWINEKGATAGDPLISKTVSGLADEGKFQFAAYSAGVFKFENSKITTLVEESGGNENPGTSDYYLIPLAAVSVISLGAILFVKKR